MRTDIDAVVEKKYAKTQEDKQAVFNIPFFDAEKFKLCTGIDVSRKPNA